MMFRKLHLFFSTEKAGVLFLFLTGIILRLRQYLTGRSLWTDEAMLAVSIVNRSFTGLFKPLEFGQGSPLGFLFLEKTAHILFGRSEYALRLFPLIAGIAAIGLFYLLLKQVTHKAGTLTALTLFVINPRLIYYSSEVKQYIFDVVVSVGLLLLVSRFLGSRHRLMDFFWLALAGFATLWLSHPAVFILAGIGLAFVIIFFHQRDYLSLRYMLGTGSIWLFTIGFMYLLVLRNLQQSTIMKEYWQGAFLPIPPWSVPGWMNASITENIGVQFGIPYATYLVFGLFFVGWGLLWKRNYIYALTIGLVFVVTLTASALHLYPVLERMILFIIPIGLILIGQTVDTLYQSTQKIPILRILPTALFTGFLIYGPLATSTGYFIKPKYQEHIRPTMDFLQQSWRDSDALYVSYGAVPAFRFYAPVYGLSQVSYISSESKDYQIPNNIVQQLETLKGNPRAWILMTHVYENEVYNEKNLILDHLNQIGKKKREFHVPGSSVYLYLFDLGS